MKKYLTVIHKEVGGKEEEGKNPARIDKRGKPYNYIMVETPGRVPVEVTPGKIIMGRVQIRRSAFKAYPESYLLDATGRGIPEFGHDLEVGETVLGDIVTREIEPRFIPSDRGKEMGPDPLTGEHVKGNWVSYASRIAFGDSEDTEKWEIAIKRAFRDAGFQLKGEETLPKHQPPIFVGETDLGSVQTTPAALANPDDVVQDDKAARDVAKTGDKSVIGGEGQSPAARVKRGGGK